MGVKSGSVDGLSGSQPTLFYIYLVKSSRRCVNEVLTYVMEGFGGANCIGIPVLSQHIPEARPRADVTYSFVDSLSAVGIVSAFIGISLGSWFLLYGAFCFVAIAPLHGA